jgi:HK97 gp10 family phage protein
MSAEIEGLEDLIKNLHTLPERTARKVVRSAVNTALTPSLRAAREHAPEESGTLKLSLAKKVKTYTDNNVIVGIIGPDKGVSSEFKGEKRVPWRYAHLVESGHIDEAGNFVPGKPFMRPAYDETESQMVSIMEDKVGKGIEKEAAKQ